MQEIKYNYEELLPLLGGDTEGVKQRGGLGKVWGVFDGKLEELIEELNSELAA